VIPGNDTVEPWIAFVRGIAVPGLRSVGSACTISISMSSSTISFSLFDVTNELWEVPRRMPGVLGFVGRFWLQKLWCGTPPHQVLVKSAPARFVGATPDAGNRRHQHVYDKIGKRERNKLMKKK
jgi:hypothetical protein